ncbi:MAG: hypothetical protein ABI683_01060 [Ginsengibacter sp.]
MNTSIVGRAGRISFSPANVISRKAERNNSTQIKILKWGIWSYFFLLIFEGALRKWVVPSLSTPLLIIRDPIAIGLILMSIRLKQIRINSILAGVVLISIVSIFTALFFGHGSLPVAIFGARIFLIHFPLIFIIGKVFTLEDVIAMGKVFLKLSIPMTVLIVLQFYSPQGSWVNRGVGDDMTGGGFSGAMGFYRPPATFSFITGTVAFYSVVACYVFYFFFNIKLVNKLLLYAATFCLVISIPVSISRSLFLTIIVIFAFTLFAISRESKHLKKIFGGFLVVCLALIILSNTSKFQTATEAFSERFSNASKSEGGLTGALLDRYLGGMLEAIQNSSEQSFFGYGIGMGTNVGSMLLAGKTKFLIAESEWGRVIGEMGPIMGLLIIFFRLKLCAVIGLAAYKKIQTGNLLPWILLSFVLLNIPQGQWAQPTILGFSVLVCGLAIASLKDSK